MPGFAELLEAAVSFHGHLCPGQVLGVRMAMVGCREVGIDGPKGDKRLVVFVEIDRCAADAIQSVTGCRLGKRTLRHVDYGKMAATFLNLKTGQAVRVVAREEARKGAWKYAPEVTDEKDAQLRAYATMPEEELLLVQPVRVKVPEADMPSPPVSRVTCAVCGEGVNDHREVRRHGRTLCRACAYGAYYSPAEDASQAVEIASPRGPQP